MERGKYLRLVKEFPALATLHKEVRCRAKFYSVSSDRTYSHTEWYWLRHTEVKVERLDKSFLLRLLESWDDMHQMHSETVMAVLSDNSVCQLEIPDEVKSPVIKRINPENVDQIQYLILVEWNTFDNPGCDHSRKFTIYKIADRLWFKTTIESWHRRQQN